MSRPSAGLALCLVLLRLTAAQSNSAQRSQSNTEPPLLLNNAAQDPPTLRTTTNLVLIDVVVRDKKDGKSVENLDRSNFQLFEDGQPQALTIFEEHRATDAFQASQLPALPQHVYSSFPRYALRGAANVLLIDALNTRIAEQSYARQQLSRYLRTIPPGTYISIFLLGSDLRMVKGFTTDLNAVIATLGAKVGSAAKSSAPGNSPNDSAAAEQEVDAGSSLEMSSALQSFSHETRDLSASIRRDMALAALKKLARFLNTVPGRKNLIWISAAFPVSIGQPNDESYRGDFFLKMREVDEMMARARVAVYPVDARGLMTLPNANLANDPSGGQSVTLKGLVAGGMNNSIDAPRSWASEHMAMIKMAEETSGKAYYDTNALGQSAVSAIADGSNYYTLGYYPTNRKFNGAFRKVKVSLDRQSELSYRRGYDAVDPSDSGKAKIHPVNPMSAAMLRGGVPLSEIIFEARVLPAADPQLIGENPNPEPAGKPDKPLMAPITRYMIDYSIDPHHLTLTTLPDGRRRVELELAQAVFDRDGVRVNQSDAGLELNLTPGQLSKSFKAGIPVHQEIDAPAGNIVLLLGVRDVATERIGTIEIPLQPSESSKTHK